MAADSIMSNQSFDSNETSSISGSNSGAGPIPIAQQLRNQGYLSNIQDKMEEILRVSGVEATDENADYTMPSSSATRSSGSSAPARVNRMDSFFEQIAQEEEQAANKLAEQLASKSEADVAIDDESEHYPVDNQQEAAGVQEDSADVLPDAPLEVPPTDSRPTGYAGLSAGLAAAGLENLGARLAEESTAVPDHELLTEESYASAQPPSLPPTPTVLVIDPPLSSPSFDLEAARLEEVSGPVFSQEFDEKELSPEERLSNRLQREKLVPSENHLVDQLPDSIPPLIDQEPVSEQHATDHSEAFDVTPPLAAESDLGESEPINDLFVEVPQVPQLSEVEHIDFDHSEDEFKELQKREESHIEQAQIEYEQGTDESVNDAQREVPADEPPVDEQKAEQDRLAAIAQAERVKAAREKVSQVTREADHATSSAMLNAAPDPSQQETSPTPMPLEPTSEAKFANRPDLIPPVALSTDSPSSGVRSPENSDVKRPVAGHHFQDELFHKCMLEYLSDGVVFVDHKQRVKMWSRGAQNATGIVPEVVVDRPLLPQTINLCDTNGNGLQLDKCPVAACLRTLEVVSGEYKISNGTNLEGMKVELTAIPVIDENRYVNGAVVMFHDRTAHVNLQRQLKDLYEFSVLDPLTQVANRAEFERVQQEYVLAFQQSDDFNCSIIICDIDYFKSINDNFGHPVGDEALMSFAAMLKRYVRPQDLVARYGGEEFVILCADCDSAAAVQRAEEIRMALYKTPQPMLGGKSISASFGVSELREGDTAMDFFVRADTALLKAKETGRNRVVASDGTSPNGPDEPATEISETGIRWSAQQRKSQALICEEFKTDTPIQVLVEKLRGFIIENDAVLQRVEPEFLSMEIEVEGPLDYSKKGAFTMNVEFKESETPFAGTTRNKTVNYIRATIYAGRMKSWFSTNHIDLAPHLLSELRRFLMIGDKASRVSVDLATKNVR